LKIGSILGIPIKIHFTFLIILFIFAWFIATIPFPLGFGELEDDLVKYLMGIFTTLAIFAGVLAHELAHSVVARRSGIKIKNITLLIFGGVASMEEIPRKPKLEIRMALAGPIMSVIIGVVVFVPTYFFISPESAGPIIYPFIYNFGLINLVLGFFNMLPAFPMDGGRVLRAMLAMRMPYLEATRRAVSIGKTFALLMALFGVFYSIWLILIALFIYFGASEEERGTTVSMQLEGTMVSEVMTGEVETIEPRMRISELVEKMLETRHMGFPVVSSERLVGIVTLSDLTRVPAIEREALYVEDVMKKEVRCIRPDDEAMEALKLMTQMRIGRLVVMDGERIVGIVTRSDLLDFVQIKTKLPAPHAPEREKIPPRSGW